MFIRTNSNIYEINKCDDTIIEDKKVTGYYIGETDVVKEEQVIAKTEAGVEDLVDCFVLYVDGKYKFASEDLLAIESYAIKFDFDVVEIYGMIFTKSRFNGEVGSKVIVKHAVTEDGHGYYKLIKEGNL
jgi:hypothetical protein